MSTWRGMRYEGMDKGRDGPVGKGVSPPCGILADGNE